MNLLHADHYCYVIKKKFVIPVWHSHSVSMKLNLVVRFCVLIALGLVPIGAISVLAQPLGGGQTPGQRVVQWLPKDATTHHALKFPDREINFTATAGSLGLAGSSGFLEAEIAYIACVLSNTDPAERPITFIVNGGPGAASAYLNLLAIGPWRAPLNTSSSSNSSGLQPNGETWLDFTDLVFIDPPGTGYSRVIGAQRAQNHFYSVTGDIESLSNFIQRWLKENDRLRSPIFFVGESYGGFRGPLLARKLQAATVKSLDGMILVSPVLDFTLMQRAAHIHSPWVNAATLPSMAAIWAEQQKSLTPEILQEAEHYASGEYVADLLRGVDDKGAVERIAQRLERFIGFEPEKTKKLRGRINRLSFEREWSSKSAEAAQLQRANGQQVNSISPSDAWKNEDLMQAEINSSLSPARVRLYESYLNYRPDGRYEILNIDVARAWNWNNGRYALEAVSALREALEYDKEMPVLITHGLMDLLTPYYATRLLINQIPSDAPSRLSFKAYPGGHMFYTRAQSRESFKIDAQKLVQDVLTKHALRKQ